MKRIILFTAIVSLVCVQFVFAQFHVRGSLNSNMYSWENSAENQQYDYYQGLRLKLFHEKNSGIYVSTNLRAAYRGDPAEWDERLYNLYANWDLNNNYKIRVGRQFIHAGVINGTLDAGLISAKIGNNVRIKVVGGTEATQDRNFKMRDWDNGNAFGGFVSYQTPYQSSIEFSYFQKARWEETFWQQLGAVLKGTLSNDINYYFRYDQNLLTSEYQMLRGRIMYYQPKWYATAEFTSQKPRIYEDSFFNIFEVRAYNQIRSAFNYVVGNFDVGIQYIYTSFGVSEFYIVHKADNNDSRIIGSVANRYGNIGIIYQTGFGGENFGYFGELRYDILPNLTAKIFNSFYNYERAYTNISEDALSFSAGLSYKYKRMIILNGEIQQSNNTYYKKDWRGLLRLTYLFNI